MNKVAINIIAFCFFTNSLYAQFTLTGELRPRTEYRHGYKTLADSAQKNALFTDQRTRLNFGYKSEGYQVKITLQNIRTWGSQSQLVSADGLTSIHEAWGEAFITKKFAFKFGRQEIILDDHRIFGNVGWAQQARSHDAGIIKYKDSTFTAHVGFAYNQDKPQLKTTLYTVPKSYKAFQYLWMHKDFNKNLNISFLFLNNGKQVSKDITETTFDTTLTVMTINDTTTAIITTVDSTTTVIDTKWKDNYSQTIGARISYKKDKLAANGVFYYQTGIDGDWANTRINASLFGLDVSYKATEKLTATIGFERQSGQSQADTTKSYNEVNHSFTPFYGTNHKFNGHMDYFYVGNSHGGVGLQDIFFKLKYKPKKYFVGADVHFFSATADVYDAKKSANTGKIESMKSSLGTEIDLSFGFKLSKGVMLKAGYSQMFGTETLAILKGVTDYKGDGRIDETSNWAWMMIIIKPTFFKGE